MQVYLSDNWSKHDFHFFYLKAVPIAALGNKSIDISLGENSIPAINCSFGTLAYGQVTDDRKFEADSVNSDILNIRPHIFKLASTCMAFLNVLLNIKLT